MKASGTVIQSMYLPFYVEHLRTDNIILAYRSPDQECYTQEPHTHADLRQVMRFELQAVTIMERNF